MDPIPSSEYYYANKIVLITLDALEDVMGGGTSCDLAKLNPLYRQSRISIVPNILRAESAKLLKAYFQNPENNYWKGSLLAQHAVSI